MYDDNSDQEKPKRWNHALTIAAIVVFSIILWSSSKTPQLDWLTDFEQAKTRATAEHKPILLLFSADWCGPCNRMKKSTWPDLALKKLLGEKFIPVYLNIDRPEVKPIAGDFNVDGIPHIVLTDAAGRPLKNSAVVGARSAKEMIAFLTPFAP